MSSGNDVQNLPTLLQIELSLVGSSACKIKRFIFISQNTNPFF
jgi:hypothetical protein